MRAAVFLQGLLAFIIVSFGQPSFAPWLGPISASIGYALFWRATRIYPFLMQKFWRGTLWFGGISFIQLSWMSSIAYQGVYIIFVWIALALLLGIQFGFLSLLIPYNKPLSVPRILAIASIWTLMEWSRFHFLCGYSWNLSGLALSNLFSVQFAALFGILGLSFWVIFSNLFALRAFLEQGVPRFLQWGAVCLVPYLFGLGHLAYHKHQLNQSNPQSYQALLVQTGLLPSEKVLLEGREDEYISPYKQWARILLLIEEQSVKEGEVDLIVLPEAAVPFSSTQAVYNKQIAKDLFTTLLNEMDESCFPETANEKVDNLFFAQTLANALNCEVVIGLDHRESDGTSFNSAFHCLAQNHDKTRYDKRVLMPLAEYLPFSSLAPLVKSYGLIDFFTHGKEATLFTGRVPLSASICYEETFPDKVAEGRRKGAEVLVNLTNDGWYPYSKLPLQHFEHAKIRAIENGAPLLRACNTGITAAVDSLGITRGALQEQGNEQTLLSGALLASVPLYSYATLFTKWGNIPLISACFVLIAFFWAGKKRLSL